MGLQEQIEQALKGAVREKNEDKRNAIRLLLTAIKVKEKDFKRPAEETEIQQVIASQVKQRRDSVEQYTKAGRGDLAAREEAEIQVLQSFLPEAMSEQELEALVTAAIAEVGAQSARDMGKVMKVLMPRIGGRAEGKVVNDMVRQKLQG